MALPFIATVVDSDATANKDEYLIRIRFDCDFPTGKTNPDGTPAVEHLATEQTFKLVAATAATFKTIVQTAGQAWKTAVLAQIAARKEKTVATINIGDSITFPN